MPLDKLEAYLKILNAEKKGQAVPVRNEPPVFIFTQTPAILVSIEGDPVWTSGRRNGSATCSERAASRS